MTTAGPRSTTSPASARTRLLALTGVLVLGAALALPGSPAAASVVAKVELGTADQFGVLAGSTVTNTGNSILNGLDLGVTPGTAVTGFPPGVILPPGVKHVADGVAGQAQDDATTAYNQAAGLPADNPTAYTELGGKVLLPGVYQGNLSLTGTVTLDNSDNPDAVFVFQASSTLITASSSVVTFTNADHPSCNVFWQVGSSATLGSGSTFVGTIDALTSITAGTAATIQGRLIARNGAVALDSNVISRAPCAVTPPPTETTTATVTATATVTTTPPPVTTTLKPPTVTTTVKPPTVTTTVKPPTATVTETSTFIPPPLETTTESSLPIITPPTTTPPLETTTGSSLPITTPSGTTTSTNATGITVTTTTTSDNQILTYTTVYASSTESTPAQGIDTGSGGSGGSGSSGSSGELASTGVTGVTGLTKSGVLLLVGGVVLLVIAHRRRVQVGHHRLI